MSLLWRWWERDTVGKWRKRSRYAGWYRGQTTNLTPIDNGGIMGSGRTLTTNEAGKPGGENSEPALTQHAITARAGCGDYTFTFDNDKPCA